jgi:hypothetical protein
MLPNRCVAYRNRACQGLTGARPVEEDAVLLENDGVPLENDGVLVENDAVPAEDARQLSTNDRTPATNVRARVRAVANRPETGAKRSRSEAYRSRRAADGPRKGPLRVWAGSHQLKIPERWSETTSSRSRAAATGGGRRRTRHGFTRPDRWGSVRLACGCRPAADGVVPARGGALRPPDAR